MPRCSSSQRGAPTRPAPAQKTLEGGGGCRPAICASLSRPRRVLVGGSWLRVDVLLADSDLAVGENRFGSHLGVGEFTTQFSLKTVLDPILGVFGEFTTQFS